MSNTFRGIKFMHPFVLVGERWDGGVSYANLRSRAELETRFTKARDKGIYLSLTGLEFLGKEPRTVLAYRGEDVTSVFGQLDEDELNEGGR